MSVASVLGGQKRSTVPVPVPVPLLAASATKLLGLLAECAGPAGLPRRPMDLGRGLTRLRAPLSELGILVKSGRGTDQHCVWILMKMNQSGADR